MIRRTDPVIPSAEVLMILLTLQCPYSLIIDKVCLM